MGTGYHGGFGRTLGSTYKSNTNAIEEDTYSDRGITIPENIKNILEKMHTKGDYVKGSKDDFCMTDVSVMSKETKVEFAKVTIGEKSYLIRGDSKETVIPDHIMLELKKGSGKLEFHSHPHNDDLVPSKGDRSLMALLSRTTGQQYSTIVTPNSKTALFGEHGVIETGTVHKLIDSDLIEIYNKLFGGD